MRTNEYSQPASKSSWDSQDFGDVSMVVKTAHFHKSSRPRWVKYVAKVCSPSNRVWTHCLLFSLMAKIEIDPIRSLQLH